MHLTLKAEWGHFNTGWAARETMAKFLSFSPLPLFLSDCQPDRRSMSPQCLPSSLPGLKRDVGGTISENGRGHFWAAREATTDLWLFLPSGANSARYTEKKDEPVEQQYVIALSKHLEITSHFQSLSCENLGWYYKLWSVCYFVFVWLQTDFLPKHTEG